MTTTPIDRRRFLDAAARASLMGGAAALLASCRRTSGAGPSVVAYCSADAVYARPVFAKFTDETGIRVDAVFDTEATKTTGLVQRLLAEQAGGTPRAGLWWSSEPFGTLRLAREGVLAPHRCEASERSIDGGWPADLRGKDGAWYGFASRARVFVVNRDRVPEADRPVRLSDLLHPRFEGRVALARPQFGTTRGHMAAIALVYGEEGLRGWLTSLRERGVRIYDGNATVTRAVATGECIVGLTDSDDVFAGQREGWPIELAFERSELEPGARAGTEPAPINRGMGAMLVPNTVGLVRGGPNPEAAARLLAFLLSPAAERALAESDSRNIPVHPELRGEFTAAVPPSPAQLALEEVEARVEPAMRIVSEVLGGA